MKKLFCLLLAFCALHAVIAQGWEQITRKKKIFYMDFCEEHFLKYAKTDRYGTTARIKRTDITAFEEGRYEGKDKEYLAHMNRNHKDPKIVISTIHKVKGLEADEVIVLEDTGRKTYTQATTSQLMRNFYIATTRAKQRLFILEHDTIYFVPFFKNITLNS